MSICLCMIVKDEEQVIGECLYSVKPLIDSWVIVDTGSSDRTREIVLDELSEIPGELYQREWESFGANRTQALTFCDGDWNLMLDADMTVEAHADLATWLSQDPDPDVNQWMVQIEESGTRYRLPLLTRGGVEFSYVGATHEYLMPADHRRSLLGLTITHHHNGTARVDKFERDLGLLAPGVLDGDPRAIFYTAETLRCMGRTEEAIANYDRRALLGGFEEEAWYATYQLAKLAQDVPALIEAWRARPWRHEPLSAASEIVAHTQHDDVLFVEVR